VISAIAGDMIGSAFEFNNKLRENFTTLFTAESKFTDDTVLTIATADAIINHLPYVDKYLEYGLKYPDRGYGSKFKEMLKKGKLEPSNSYGNGSAMRISPVGWAFNIRTDLLEEAKKSAACTHNHIEGVKGAQAVAYAIWMNAAVDKRHKISKSQVKDVISGMFGYDLNRKVSDFEIDKFDVTCQGTIPLCFAIFFETNSFEEAMMKAIAMGGDVDTNCCIIGSLCDSFYGLPSDAIIENVYERLPEEMCKVVTTFAQRNICPLFVAPKVVKTNTDSSEIIDNSITSLDI